MTRLSWVFQNPLHRIDTCIPRNGRDRWATTNRAPVRLGSGNATGEDGHFHIMGKPG